MKPDAGVIMAGVVATGLGALTFAYGLQLESTPVPAHSEAMAAVGEGLFRGLGAWFLIFIGVCCLLVTLAAVLVHIIPMPTLAGTTAPRPRPALPVARTVIR